MHTLQTKPAFELICFAISQHSYIINAYEDKDRVQIIARNVFDKSETILTDTSASNGAFWPLLAIFDDEASPSLRGMHK